jgi:predicted O-methyltransferase YrrM
MNDFFTRAATFVTRLQGFAARFARRGFIFLSRRAAGTAERLRRLATLVEIRLEGLDSRVGVKPVAAIPAPIVDLASANPVAAIMGSAEFAAATQFFADNPVVERSLVSPQSQALLYCLIRNLKPEHVFEIGSYRAGTTEAMCRALHANGAGVAHTVDPYCAEHVAVVLKHWPPALHDHVQLHAMDSMSFYMTMRREGIRPALIFVDGNHDYEFAMFDIACGARSIAPGGFIFVDNIAQAGPFFGGRDFLNTNPGWRELGSSARDYNPAKAFDRHRTTVINTDFMVLQAPSNYWIGERPRNFGPVRWRRSGIDGLRISIRPPNRAGTLHVQAILRGFGALPAELPLEATVQLGPELTETSVAIAFTPPGRLIGDFVHFTVEPWLIWHGPEPLQLTAPPEPL